MENLEHSGGTIRQTAVAAVFKAARLIIETQPLWLFKLRKLNQDAALKHSSVLVLS